MACDGDHTLEKVGAPSVDCAPFKCDGKQCRTTCASARDCVAPAVCSYAGCAWRRSTQPSSETVWGCAQAPAAAARAGGVGARVLAAAGLAAVRRARRWRKR